MSRRILALASLTAFVAVACGAVGGASPGASSPAELTPDSSAAPSPDGSPGGTDHPALGTLRVSTSGWATDFSQASVDLGDFLGGGPGKDGIPSIDRPLFESIDAARSWLSDRSPVISLTIRSEARAYPLAILIWHEIVNDAVGGTPIVVTFCPLCNTGLAFERTVDGVIHDFGTTGNLRYSDLVMYDRQTESWWQQVTGTAIVGTLTGTQLRFLPAQIIALGDFATAYPDGRVLSRNTGQPRDYGRNPYAGYDSVDDPFLFDGVLDGRLSPMERVVTIGVGTAAVGFPFSELRKVGVATSTLDGEPIAVFWTPGTASALDQSSIDDGRDIGASGVFRPIANGRQLTFARASAEESSAIVDRETGSTWSVTGLAIAGSLAGSQLEPVAHGDHFWFAWAAFEPDTTIWQAP
ncbi:MAG: DUF3179 domain-containing protein [Candidatus Limnocylindrales bacterium]